MQPGHQSENRDRGLGKPPGARHERPNRSRRRRRLFGFGLLALAVGFILVQAVPYGRSHSNPPVLQEPAWNSPRTRTLAAGACFDCHSNQTVWPWYSNIAPVSWLVQNDVDEGRGELNFSEADRVGEAKEAAMVVREGEMPPSMYQITHPAARLSEADLQELAAGLQATFGNASVEEKRERD